MTTANTLDDFPADAFTIVVFCEGCDRETRLDRSTVPAGLAVQDLTSRLRCTRCGASNSSIRIVYTGAGGFPYGPFPGSGGWDSGRYRVADREFFQQWFRLQWIHCANPIFAKRRTWCTLHFFG